MVNIILIIGPLTIAPEQAKALPKLLLLVITINYRTISELKWGQLEGGTAIGMGLLAAKPKPSKKAPQKARLLFY